VEIRRRIRVPLDLARGLCHLGLVTRRTGDLDRSRGCYCESLTLAGALKNGPVVVSCLYGLALNEIAVGDTPRAARLVAAADAALEAGAITLPPRFGLDDEARLREVADNPALAADAQAGRQMTVEQAIQYALESNAG
jgi:hypothetical protein